MRLFSPRKTTLLFVIRDKTKVHLSDPDNNLEGAVKHLLPFPLIITI